jgi:enoyl-CoA hydratase
MGLVNRVVSSGGALDEAVAWGLRLAALPQTCLRNDRRSALAQWGQPVVEAMGTELRLGLDSLASPDAAAGGLGFASGAGRHGSVVDPAGA